MHRARVILVYLLVALVAGPTGVGLGAGRAAWAQGKANLSAKKKAEAHFKQGQEYQKAGAWDQAIEEYSAAYALVALPALLYNIGLCYMYKGDKPKAVEYFKRFLDEVPEGDAADEAREYVATLVRQINDEKAAADAAKRKEAEAAEAERKRKEAEAADAERKRRDAEAAEAERKRREDEAAETERKRKEAEAAEAERRRQAGEPPVVVPVVPPAPDASKPKPAPSPPRPPRPQRVLTKTGRGMKLGGTVGIISGLAIGAVGGYFYIQYVDFRDQAGRVGDIDAARLLSDADTQFGHAKLAWIAGGALVVTGIVLIVAAPTELERPKSPQVKASIGPAGGFIFVDGTF